VGIGLGTALSGGAKEPGEAAQLTPALPSEVRPDPPPAAARLPVDPQDQGILDDLSKFQPGLVQLLTATAQRDGSALQSLAQDPNLGPVAEIAAAVMAAMKLLGDRAAEAALGRPLRVGELEGTVARVGEAGFDLELGHPEEPWRLRVPWDQAPAQVLSTLVHQLGSPPAHVALGLAWLELCDGRVERLDVLAELPERARPPELYALNSVLHSAVALEHQAEALDLIAACEARGAPVDPRLAAQLTALEEPKHRPRLFAVHLVRGRLAHAEALAQPMAEPHRSYALATLAVARGKRATSAFARLRQDAPCYDPVPLGLLPYQGATPKGIHATAAIQLPDGRLRLAYGFERTDELQDWEGATRVRNGTLHVGQPWQTRCKIPFARVDRIYAKLQPGSHRGTFGLYPRVHGEPRLVHGVGIAPGTQQRPALLAWRGGASTPQVLDRLKTAWNLEDPLVLQIDRGPEWLRLTVGREQATASADTDSPEAGNLTWFARGGVLLDDLVILGEPAPSLR
jgi:hypothetical protein